MTETDLQRRIVQALRQLGVWVFRVNSGRAWGAGGVVRGAPSGTPDLVCPALGWLEVKLPGKPLSADQKEWHERAERAGVRVAVVTSAVEAVEVVKGWKTAKEAG